MATIKGLIKVVDIQVRNTAKFVIATHDKKFGNLRGTYM